MATRLYEILEVRATATAEEIRKAYKRKALKTHPDRLGPSATVEEKKNAEEQFRLVNQAYEILIDVEKRKAYDFHGQWPPPEERPRPSQSSRRPTVYDEFDDDPFGHPFVHHHDRFRSFAFTDPFTLFESIFGDVAPRHYGRPSYTATSFYSIDPFSQLERQLDAELNGFMPFSTFSGLFGGLSGSLSLTGTGAFGSLPGTSSRGSSGGQWVSESYSTRTINGVTQSVYSRRDCEGNEHATRTLPDGREVYTINGVEQPSRGQIQNRPVYNQLQAPPQQRVLSPRIQRRSSKASTPIAATQQELSYRPDYNNQYAMSQPQLYQPPSMTAQSQPNQHLYSNPHPRPTPQYADYDMGSPSRPGSSKNDSDSRSRTEGQRGEKRQHSPSRESRHMRRIEEDDNRHHDRQQNKTVPTSSRHTPTTAAASLAETTPHYHASGDRNYNAGSRHHHRQSYQHQVPLAGHHQRR